MIALTLAVSVLFGVSANFEADISTHCITTGTDGIVESFTSMNQPMGLDYDHTNGWLWQATQDGGWVYTVDPTNGSYIARFDINLIFGTIELASNGCHLDETNNYLYLADFNGDGGTTFYDVIYCFDVDNPDNPAVIDTWDLGAADGLLGITYKAPYFYCAFYTPTELRAYTLSPGGAFTLENTWPGLDYGGLWYDETWNVFYTHDALGTDVRILDGDDPSTVLDSFNPGCGQLTCAMTDDSNPAYLWTADRPALLNCKIDDEYTPGALENSTWGNIKTVF
ncbi:MAG: hypothetical protein KAT09_03750 [Candidatus Aegiribacteria sp.]|nr:hypothetical protein [Candidatus Aegiribacteria sp.]